MARTDRLESWIDKFPYDDLVAELEGLQKQVQVLNTRLFALQDLKQMYERIRAIQTGGQQDPGPLPTQPLPPGHPAVNPPTPAQARPPLREAIRTVMAADPRPEWTTDDLWSALTTRGWLRRDAQGKNSMFAMLSGMATQGQLVRVGRGVYRLKVSAPDDLLREIDLGGSPSAN